MTNTATLHKEAAKAAQTAEAARREAADLEAEIIAGNTKISVTMLEDQERQARAAELTARAARARIEEDQKKQRDSLLAHIRDEVEHTNRDHLAGLLRHVENAARAFAEAATEYNDKVYGWRSQLIDAGVAEYDGTVDTSVDEGLTIGVSPSPTVYLGTTAYQYIPNVEEITKTAAEFAFGQITRDPYAELSAYVPDGQA